MRGDPKLTVSRLVRCLDINRNLCDTVNAKENVLSNFKTYMYIKLNNFIYYLIFVMLCCGRCLLTQFESRFITTQGL